MSANVWRSLSIVLSLVVLLQFYLIFSEYRSVPDIAGASRPTTPAPVQDPVEGHWVYDVDRDSANTGLSQAQCDEAFPELYYEIDRAVSYWQKRGYTLTPNDTEISWRKDGAFRLMIHDNELRVLEMKGAWYSHGYMKRSLYLMLQLYRALLGATARGERLPNIEFSVTVDDMSLIPGGKDDTHSIWTFTRRLGSRDHEREWLVPDFNFFASPPFASSWLEMQKRAQVHDSPLVDKIPKAVWRGSTGTNPYVRGHLVEAAEGKEWSDIKEVKWKKQPDDVVNMEDLCRYMFPVHTEGRSWSGRLKYLLNCNSLPVIHELEWTTSYYHLLKADGPEQNYVPVRRDFSDLNKQITHYLANKDEAQRVADNAVATFRSRYTSPAAEACYWRRLVHGYSKVAFEPEAYETVKVRIAGEEVEKPQLRGIPFDEYIWINPAET